MPHPATPGPGEGESSTVAPIYPSANAQASSSRVLLSDTELKSKADTPRSDPGAEVDLRVRAMAGSDSSSSSQRLKPPKGWLHFVAGGVGGMCGATITSPLDVVKTRLQSDLFRQQKASAAAGPARTGILATAKQLSWHFVETGQLLRDIAVKEGPRALFKGLGPTLVGVVPARSINFFTYGNGKIVLAERFNGGRETTLVHLSAAAAAGIVTATATNPIWVIKTRLQLESHEMEKAEKTSRAAAVQARKGPPSGGMVSNAGGSIASSRTYSSASTKAQSSVRTPSMPGGANFFRPARSPARPGTSSVQMLARIIRKEGVTGLYKGMSASYLGVAEGTIQWVLYEQLKRMSSDRSDSRARSNGNGAGESSFASKLSGTVGAAGTAKLVASLITYPHEVIRTRLRQQPGSSGGPKYTGLLQTIRLVWAEEGAAALYGGLSAHLLRVVPNAAVMFSIYEVALRLGALSQAREEEAAAAHREQQSSLLTGQLRTDAERRRDVQELN